MVQNLAGRVGSPLSPFFSSRHLYGCLNITKCSSSPRQLERLSVLSVFCSSIITVFEIYSTSEYPEQIHQSSCEF